MKNKSLLNLFLFALTFCFCYSQTFGQIDLVETIYFKTNSFVIDKKYEPTLNLVAKQLSSDSFSYLKVIGYADTRGSKNHNDILSGKRADAVYNYLLSRSNFDTTKVFVTWLGESADVYDLHFPSAHPQQRCVDIWIKFYRKPK